MERVCRGALVRSAEFERGGASFCRSVFIQIQIDRSERPLAYLLGPLTKKSDGALLRAFCAGQ